jgi:hypothetical protein
MLNSRIHTAIAALAAAAALSAAGVTDAASAMPVQRIGAAAQSHLVVTVVHPAVKAAGSAGIKGYGDDTCQSLANDYNTAVNASQEGLVAGDTERTEQNGALANRIYAQLTDNCMVID